MKKPTDKQISKEIEALKALKQTVLQYSIFGDDYHERLDAQIAVLEERLSEDQAFDRFGDSENPGATVDIVCDAAEAARWLTGEEENPPSDGWRS